MARDRRTENPAKSDTNAGAAAARRGRPAKLPQIEGELLRLQRAAGNSAVTGMINGSPVAAAGAVAGSPVAIQRKGVTAAEAAARADGAANQAGAASKQAQDASQEARDAMAQANAAMDE